MRIAFTADEVGFEADEYALVCGLAGEDQWLTFQRDSEDSEDDWGVYLEYTEQANGGYGCIAACRVSSTLLSIDLSKQLGELAGVTGFDISLRLSSDELATLRDGLRQVFRGQMELLSISEAA